MTLNSYQVKHPCHISTFWGRLGLNPPCGNQMFLLFCLALRKNDYEGDSEMIPLALVMRRTVREIKRKEREGGKRQLRTWRRSSWDPGPVIIHHAFGNRSTPHSHKMYISHEGKCNKNSTVFEKERLRNVEDLFFTGWFVCLFVCVHVDLNPSKRLTHTPTCLHIQLNETRKKNIHKIKNDSQ